jgi:hypothetical protein
LECKRCLLIHLYVRIRLKLNFNLRDAEMGHHIVVGEA